VVEIKIGLLDVDGHNFPNLALMKLSAWHKSQGDEVDWWMALDHYDMVYKSKVFTFTPDISTVIQADKIIEGGTGYGLQNKLPDAVERMQPDYSIYPQYKEAYGFLTRGCPNNCPFCIVSKKEGRCSKQVADANDFKADRKIIKLLDPNLLACKDRDRLLQQLAETKSEIDFTQGLDARLLDADNIKLLNKVKIKMVHFAWDLMKNTEAILKGLELYASKGKVTDERKRRVYVLTNYNTTTEENLYRIYKLREMRYDPFVMIYDKENASTELKHMARWVNNKFIFRKCERFEDYNPKIG
jgi:hypothetical protein